MNDRRPSALDRIRAEEAELYGVDFVLGLTDKPERREPERTWRPVQFPPPDWLGEDRPPPAA